MIEVFKTNISEIDEVNFIAGMLRQYFPGYSMHFDLHDCDKILRIEATEIDQGKVISLLVSNGYYCEVLQD